VANDGRKQQMSEMAVRASYRYLYPSGSAARLDQDDYPDLVSWLAESIAMATKEFSLGTPK
jgi:hypothetical protein